ncbi:MAG: hypothetical protein Q8Q62_12965 [Mesorhizobium sp.]|nr:hypothetical protein [Mesorhizobium sp.]
MRLQSFGFIALAAAIGLPGGAGAVEPDQLGARIKTLFATQGVDIAWATATANGSSVVFNGVTVASGGESIPVGVITLGDVSEEDDGDYLVGTLDMPSYAYSRDGIDFSVGGVEVTGLLLPSATTTDPMASSGIFETLEVGKISASKDGKTAFQLEGLVYEIERGDDGQSLTFSGAAERFSADLSAAGDPQSLAMATALGLANPTGSFETSGSFSQADGTVTLDQLDFTIDNAGTLGLTLDLSGYTPQLVKAMQELQKNQATMTDEEKSAQGLAYLGLMQQLNFNGASIRYDDNQLAERALNLAGGMQNMQRADFSSMAKMLIPDMLSEYVSPEFAAKVTDEVVKFVDAPKSLEIRAAPANPVPFAMIGAGAMMAPKSLPDTLGLTVVANEDAE